MNDGSAVGSSAVSRTVALLDPTLLDAFVETWQPQSGQADERARRLSFAHDSFGSFFAAVAAAEPAGISLARSVPVDVGEMRALAPALDDALDGVLRPEFAELALSIADTPGLTAAAAAWHDLFTGKLVHRRLGEHRAEPYYRRAHAAIDDPERRVYLAANLGMLHTIHTMDGRRALAYLAECEAYYRARDDREGVLGALVGQLLAYSRLGQFATRVRRFDPWTLVTAERRASADRLLRVGILYRQYGLTRQALDLLRRSRALFAESGDELGLAELNIAEGDALASIDRWTEAIARYEAAHALLAELERRGVYRGYQLRFHTGNAHLGLGRAFLVGQHDVAAAERHAQAALSIMRQFVVRPHLARALTLRAACHRARRQVAAALAAYREALALYREGGERLRVAQTLWRLLPLTLRAEGLRAAWAELRELAHIIRAEPRWLVMQLHPGAWSRLLMRGL